MPLQTLRTSNSSLCSRALVRVRWFEAAYRLVIVRAWQKKTPPCSILHLVSQEVKRGNS